MNSPGFSADLTSFDLLDLVQVIHLDRRDLCLVLRAGSQVFGVLRFQQGELLWAECGEMGGEEAFLALAAQQYGQLEQLPWSGNGERNVYQPLSRLVMEAVAYREQQGGTAEDAAWSSEGWGQPEEVVVHAPALPIPANGYLQRPAGGQMRDVEDAEEGMPVWMRQVHAAVEEISAQPTGAMPMSPAQGAPPGEPAAQAGEQPSPTTAPFSLLNGKRSLPGLPPGVRSAPQSAAPPADEPPTVPLPSVQSSLMDYAPRRVSAAIAPAREQEAAPELVAEPEPVPDQAAAMPSAPAQPAAASVPDAPTPGEARPKPSSLSLLEQLAYGAGGSASAAAEAAPAASYNGIALPGTAALEPGKNGAAPPGPTAPVEGANGTAAFTGARMVLPRAAPAGPAGNGVAPGAAQPPVSRRPAEAQAGVGAAPSSIVWPLSAETVRKLQLGLEGLALEVGAALLATAILRADGAVVAQHSASKRADQDLSSPAYHLAHVMQSSLRALLMGGWGELDETLITGSTHTVVLRRLGRAGNGLFHMTVLERGGNPGLCRVLMRNAEPALLQMVAPQ